MHHLYKTLWSCTYYTTIYAYTQYTKTKIDKKIKLLLALRLLRCQTPELLLMNSYGKYERECIETSKAVFAEKMPELKEALSERAKVESSLAKGIFKFFREKK